MNRSRLLVPLAAAVAVLVVLGGVWWVTTASDDMSEASPGAGAGADSGRTGGGSSGSPGADGPGRPQPSPTEPEIGQPRPGTVRVDGYLPRSSTVLALNYSIGVPECYGTVGEARVEETARQVVVTLVHDPAEIDSDQPCIEIALMESIDVHLTMPLGDRLVKDGAYDDHPVVAKAEAAYDAPQG